METGINMKQYSEVEVGDKAYYCETNEYIGKVIWKGKATELDEDQIIDWDMTIEEIDENFDLVIVDEDTGAFDDSNRLYNYDNDPCGVYCKKKIKLEDFPEPIYWKDYVEDEEPESISGPEELYSLMFSVWEEWDNEAENDSKMDDKLRANVCYSLTFYYQAGHPINSNVIKAMIAQL